jgi:hypothetical protein
VVGKSQRTKGASYEREVAAAFNSALGLSPEQVPCATCGQPKTRHPFQHPAGPFICTKYRAPDESIKRNIGQARDGGNDLNVGPLVVECKRRKTLKVFTSWMQQAIDATPPGKVPVVVARQDQGESIIILRLEDYLTLHGPQLKTEIGK